MHHYKKNIYIYYEIKMFKHLFHKWTFQHHYHQFWIINNTNCCTLLWTHSLWLSSKYKTRRFCCAWPKWKTKEDILILSFCYFFLLLKVNCFNIFWSQQFPDIYGISARHKNHFWIFRKTNVKTICLNQNKLGLIKTNTRQSKLVEGHPIGSSYISC